jgi:hypothetical protein
MFRKLRSNRDPRDTLYSELRKEFGVYADKMSSFFEDLTLRHPRLLFAAMVILLLVSVSTAVWRHKKPLAQRPAHIRSEQSLFDTELSRVLAAGEALRQTIHLRRQIDSISHKKVLTSTDSMALIRALDSLQHIQLNLSH